ncbi:uncharacterized protein [Oscarella lobularis]|uniref:uncharacterized protein n=1 Tax=Oscarella lobularis TaxID=121494 RepID=UPI003313736F
MLASSDSLTSNFTTDVVLETHFSAFQVAILLIVLCCVVAVLTILLLVSHLRRSHRYFSSRPLRRFFSPVRGAVCRLPLSQVKVAAPSIENWPKPHYIPEKEKANAIPEEEEEEEEDEEEEINLLGNRHRFGIEIEPTSAGELLLSLCYNPHSNKICVIIMKMRNLARSRSRGVARYPDPYTEVCLMRENKQLYRKKTTIKRNTSCPIFNESFFINLTSFHCSIMTDGLHLLLRIMDHNLMCESRLIGHLLLGPRCSDAKRFHWQDMLDTPRKPVAKWHQIEKMTIASADTKFKNY